MSFFLKGKVWVVLIGVFILGISGCEKKERGVVAQVGNQSLTEEDVEYVFSDYDSVTIEQKRDYVNRWIDNELIYQEAKRRGFDQDENLRRNIRNMTKDLIIVDFLQKEISQKIFSSENEAKAFYQKNKNSFVRENDEICASHILLPTKQEADSARDRIGKGEAFAEVAKKMSIDPETRERGGDLGCFDRVSVHPRIAEVAFSHRIGDVTKPFQTDWGWHILLIKDKKKKGSLREFELVKDQIFAYLDDQKRKEKVESFLGELKKKTRIERYSWAILDEEIPDTSQKE
ncbi:MAG: hypothetical protein AMJ90_01695 [candidate division Zixibacteria bacterium SM23_73_2]|nr:MAG: hypothetical protein AMJ90_01695 [candidate division Zixibacteria bacterium SM23_73_2]